MRIIAAIGMLTAVAAHSNVPQEELQADDYYSVPSFTRAELLAQPSPRLRQVLETTGLLSVKVPQELQHSLQDLCACPPVHHTVTLPDGKTVRSTLATATLGRHDLLPLPDDDDACGNDRHGLETVRDVVHQVSETFADALSHYLQTPLLLRRNQDKQYYQDLSQVLQQATHLEHFHLYNTTTATQTNTQASHKEPVLPLHTDAGLFLTFVPGMDCQQQEYSDDSGLYISTSEHQFRKARFEPNTVGIMLGQGAQDWLSSSIRLKATRHAVVVPPNRVRAWYGKMHLVPNDAMVGPRGETFASLRQTVGRSQILGQQDMPEPDAQVPVLGCGLAPPKAQGDEQSSLSEQDFTVTTKPRRRLVMVDDASYCNNVTNFYCWMSCLDIPDLDQMEEKQLAGEALYCLDPSAVDESLSQAVSKCEENGVPGLAMNTNCLGMWKPREAGVVEQDLLGDSDYDLEDEDEPFCWGRTSMYMDGFNWIGTTCAIYLFPGWVLDTQGKFIVATLGSILFGTSLEAVIYARRLVVPGIQAPRTRLLASAASYCLQLTLAYSVMLVIMIYSGPLFIAVIVGLTTGHVLFNAKDAVFSEFLERYQQRAVKSAKCCSSSKDTEEHNQSSGYGSCDGGCDSGSTESTDTAIQTDSIPEGSTPCCQHHL